MKKLFLTIGVCLCIGCIQMNATNPETTEKFCFHYSSNIFDNTKAKVSQKDVKTFGPEVAKLIALLDDACIKYSKSEADYKPRIVKPTLYNTLVKAVSYYRKEVRKGNISKEEATRELTDLLQKGYVCVFEDTTKLEQQLASADTPQEIIQVMNGVSVVAEN